MKIMSDAGGNFVSKLFNETCTKLNIQQVVSSSYNHQSNGELEACIKFLKCMLKKCIDANADPHIFLL